MRKKKEVPVEVDIFGFLTTNPSTPSGRKAIPEASALCVGVTVFASASEDYCAVGVTAQAAATSVYVVATSKVVTNIAMNAKAGFGAWDVDVACAVCIANADVFNCFWFRSDYCVCCLCAGGCARADALLALDGLTINTKPRSKS